MKDHGWITTPREKRVGGSQHWYGRPWLDHGKKDYSWDVAIEVIIRLWLDHSVYVGLKYNPRVGPTDMYGMWYFGEITKLYAYALHFKCFESKGKGPT